MPPPGSVQRPNAPNTIHQPRAVEAPPSEAPPPPSAGQVRDEGTSAVERLQARSRVRGSRGMTMRQAVATLAAAYESDLGIHAVNDALRENPALVRALGGQSREQVEFVLDQCLGSWGASAVMGAIQSEVTATLRRSVGAAANERIHQQKQRIGERRGALAAELERLGAPPSNPARAAELQDAVVVLDQILGNLDDLQSRLLGQTWEVGDFEQTARRLAFRMGMGTAPYGTFVQEAVSERSFDADNLTKYVTTALEIALEGSHIAHGVASAIATRSLAGIASTVGLPALLLGGGLLAGFAIHGAASERHEAFIKSVHALGIR